MATIISKEISDAIDIPLVMAMKVECDKPDSPTQRNCIDPQLAITKRDGTRIGWHGCNPNKMCASCAAYWHLSCAQNYTLGVTR